MKQKDIALIAVVVIFAGVVSLVVSNFFFTHDASIPLQAEVVEEITADFPPVDERVFNKDAINPTKLIEIGDSNNKQPF
ncbi:MAG TPA: hypothetical protein VFX79_01325 [Candidatus Saccharimonadales bacterium]|nr:hypothetical protein [Candidatus Saccharimonadales bacterium]